ncbi:MAG: hypothetical protein ABFD66_08730, partial [Smithella sp.]
MSSKEDLAKEYAARIKKAYAKDEATLGGPRHANTKREIKSVQSDIDGLTYSSSKRQIDDEDKIYIYKKIIDELGKKDVVIIGEIITEQVQKASSIDDTSELV